MSSKKQINTFEESVVSVDEAAEHIRKISGKKGNRHLILRWMNKGVSGVRLKSIRIGSGIYTSREALNEFLTECREARRKKISKLTSDGMRRAKIVDIEAEAKSLGI